MDKGMKSMIIQEEIKEHRKTIFFVQSSFETYKNQSFGYSPLGFKLFIFL